MFQNKMWLYLDCIIDHVYNTGMYIITCFKMRSNIRMKQLKFISSSSQSKSMVLPPSGGPKFLKGLRKGLCMGLRNGL